MELLEVFSAPYPTKQVGDNLEFTSDNGITYTIKFITHTKGSQSGTLEIEFGHTRTDPRFPGVELNNTYMSKQGDPFKVMGTVYKAVEDRLKGDLTGYRRIVFYAAAEEDSKIKLYDRLGQQLGKLLGNTWLHETGWEEDGDAVKKYVFTKQSAPVSNTGTMKLSDLFKQNASKVPNN